MFALVDKVYSEVYCLFMASKQAEMVFLQIQEKLSEEVEHWDSDDTLRDCIDLLKMVHEKSLKHKINSEDESKYVLGAFGDFLAGLYPRSKKKPRKKMVLSPEEKKRRSEHMKQVRANMLKKSPTASKRTTAASKKKKVAKRPAPPEELKTTRRGISTKIEFPDGDVVYKIEGDEETISKKRAREQGLSHSMLPKKNK